MFDILDNLKLDEFDISGILYEDNYNDTLQCLNSKISNFSHDEICCRYIQIFDNNVNSIENKIQKISKHYCDYYYTISNLMYSKNIITRKIDINIQISNNELNKFYFGFSDNEISEKKYNTINDILKEEHFGVKEISDEDDLYKVFGYTCRKIILYNKKTLNDINKYLERLNIKTIKNNELYILIDEIQPILIKIYYKYEELIKKKDLILEALKYDVLYNNSLDRINRINDIIINERIPNI